jgi:hypothetical protein
MAGTYSVSPGVRVQQTQAPIVDPPPHGTFLAADFWATMAIESARPQHIPHEMVRRVLAYLWLREQRPAGLLARVRWIWKIARGLWSE